MVVDRPRLSRKVESRRTLSQRIATQKKQRGEKLSAYEAVLQKAVAEDRDVTDDEQTALDAVKEDVTASTSRSSRLEDSERIIARAAVPIIPVRESGTQTVAI